MAVVVYGLAMRQYPYLWFSVLSYFLIVLVGVSRIYCCSRLPHQIAGSWVLGYLGLLIGSNVTKEHFLRYCQQPFFPLLHHCLSSLDPFTKYASVGFVIALGLLVFALSMENNDSRLASVPKQEFLRVISDIMNGTATTPEEYAQRQQERKRREMQQVGGILPGAIDEENIRERSGDPGSARTIVTPRSAAIQKAMELEKRKSKKYYDRVKHDSFYYLQRSMMKRASEKDELFGEGNTTDDWDTFGGSPRLATFYGTPRDQISSKII